MNEARKLNSKAVIEEQERLTDPLYEKRKNKEELYKDKKKQQDIDKDKAYLLESAALAEKSKKRKGKNLTFGWDVFNEDSLYRGYYKRVKKNLEENPDLKEEGVDRAALVANEVENQIEKRAEFSRRRMFIDEKDVDYINERNRVFN